MIARLQVIIPISLNIPKMFRYIYCSELRRAFQIQIFQTSDNFKFEYFS